MGFAKWAAPSRRTREKLADPGGPSETPAAREHERRRDKHFARMTTAQAEGLLGQLGLDTQGEHIAISPKTLPEVASQRAEQREQLERCIAALPSDEAAVGRLFLEGEPILRNAEQLGISRTTAQSTFDHAVTRLKKRLPAQG